MDVTGLLQALALLITGAVIPLIPVIYVAVFGQQSLVDWYRKRATGVQGEQVQVIAAKSAAQEEARRARQLANNRRRATASNTPFAQPRIGTPLVARWGFTVFVLIAYSLDAKEEEVIHFIAMLLVVSCITAPILLGCALALALSGAQAAGLVLAIGFAALLVLVFLFGGFLVMGLLLALAFDLAE